MPQIIPPPSPLPPPPNSLGTSLTVGMMLWSPSELPLNGQIFGQPGVNSPLASGGLAITIPVNWNGVGWSGMISVSHEPPNVVDRPLFSSDYPTLVQLLAGAVVNWVSNDIDLVAPWGDTINFPGYLTVGIQLAEFPGYTHGGGVKNQCGLVYPQLYFNPFQEPQPPYFSYPAPAIVNIVSPGSPTFPNIGGGANNGVFETPPCFSLLPFAFLDSNYQHALWYIGDGFVSGPRGTGAGSNWEFGWVGPNNSDWAYAVNLIDIVMQPADYHLYMSNLTLTI